MNSRQRVLAAVNHQTPDRVPIDLGGTRQSGVHASAYHQLKQRLGLRTPTRVFDVYQMLAEIEAPILDRFGADCVAVHPRAVAFGIANDRYKPWRLPDGTPVEVPEGFRPERDAQGDFVLRDAEGRPIARMPRDGFYFDRLDVAPGAAHVDPDQLDPPLLSAEECDHLGAAAEACRRTTDRAVICKMGPPQELFFGMGQGGFDRWMITLATEPDYVRAVYERLTEAWLENLRRFHAAVGDHVDIVQFNDDLGTQHGPFLSPALFRERIMPYYKRGLDWIHQHTSMTVLMHNDGAIFDLIPSLIEMGVDILNPVQTTARGMDPERLKREFGDRLTFWGAACDCQHTLPFASPEAVAEQVREAIRTLAPGGGFVLAPVHNIQAKTPPENILALFETALAEGAGGGGAR